MQPVGKFDDNHPDILGHGKKHLPQILCLYVQFVRRIRQPSQLRDTVHQKSHIVPKIPADLFFADLGILHHVMKDSCRNRLLVHLQIRQYNRNPKRMYNIRLPRLAALIPMRLLGKIVGFLNHRHIRRRMILTDTGDQNII